MRKAEGAGEKEGRDRGCGLRDFTVYGQLMRKKGRKSRSQEESELKRKRGKKKT